MATEPAPLPPPQFPALEAFIEQASSESIDELLGPIRDALATLKGPRAESGKKALKAVDRTQELLSHLLQVREQIQGAPPSGGKTKR